MFERLLRRENARRGLNAMRVVAGSFAIIILVGALLLTLPIASRDGQSVNFLSALFTATSASCVTGLIVVDTWTQWTLFGQVVILLMIQLGGLGFMTVVTIFSLLINRKIGLSERLLMVSTLNLNTMDGVVQVVRHALLGTLLFEGTGAVLLSACFIPKYGMFRGIWYGIFHAVSAFCNAGFDLLGGEEPFGSLAPFAGHPVVLLVIMSLIVIGGLGFFVWEDIRTHRRWRDFSLYTKIVLGMTAGLIGLGAVFFFTVEFHNSATIGDMPLWQKGLNSLFQSVTLRTAGFATFSQSGMLDSSAAMCILLMLIGGSSGSTAGGLKTATVAILLLTVRAGLRGREEVTLRGRAIANRRVMNALTLVLTVSVIFIAGSMFISLNSSQPFLRSAFEVASALATVGLTADVTLNLTTLSRVFIMLCMYLGRVGILSFSIAFLARARSANKLKYPTFDIMIG